MYPNRELDIVEAFLKEHSPSIYVTGAFQTICEKVKAYDAVVEYQTKQSDLLAKLYESNAILSVSILTPGGKK